MLEPAIPPPMTTTLVFAGIFSSDCTASTTGPIAFTSDLLDKSADLLLQKEDYCLVVLERWN